MEKQKMVISKKSPITFDYRGYNIIMETYINPTDQILIVREYIGLLFKDEKFEDNILLAEWSLKLSVTDKMTNIPINESEDNVGLEVLITSGLWDEIKSKISNYDEVLETIDIIVEQIQNQKALEKSMGQTIDRLVDRAVILFNKISQMDFSQEAIKDLVKTLQSETNLFEEKVLAKTPSKSVRKRNSNGTVTS